MADGEGLLTAFRVLLDDAPVERRTKALRQAIRILIDNPRGIRLGNRSPNITDADKQRWAEVKARLRQHLTSAKLGMSVVANATGLPLSTVQRSLSPAGPGPGKMIIGLLEKWLADQKANALRKLDNSFISPEANKVVPMPARNGATSLNQQQREKLAGYLALDPGEIIHEAGVSRAAASAAVAGDTDLDPKVIARLTRFLTAD